MIIVLSTISVFSMDVNCVSWTSVDTHLRLQLSTVGSNFCEVNIQECSIRRNMQHREAGG